MTDIEKLTENSSTGNSPEEPGRKQYAVDANLNVMPDDRVPQPREACIKGYMSILGAFVCLFCSFGLMNAFGTFQTWYEKHQLKDMSSSDISWIGSIQLCTFFLSGGIIGRIFDSHGPRFLLSAGTILYVFSIIIVSISSTYWEFLLAQGVLSGFGVGLLFFPSIASISTHFRKYRATAIGVALSGTSVGGVVFPIMLPRLFASLGFSWAVRVCGFTCLACCVFSMATITSSLEHGSCQPKPWMDWLTFKDFKFMIFTVGSCFCSMGLFIPYFFIVDYANAQHVPANFAFYALSAMNAGGIFGRIAPSYLSDLRGHFTLLIVASLLAGTSCLVFWPLAHTFAAVMLFATLYGCFSGAFVSLVNPCVFEISDMKDYGARMGMLYSFTALPVLFGGPIAGALPSREGGHEFLGMAIFSGTSLILGSCLIIFMKIYSYRITIKQ